MEDGVLDIADFRDITGLDLENEQDVASFNRANSRATRYLERILGWTFNYKSMYEEVAIAKNYSECPKEEQYEQWKSDKETYNFFDDPEGEEGSIKLLPYDENDANYMIDPATAIYSVKLVKVLSGSENQFITVYKLTTEEWNQKPIVNSLQGKQPLIKWLEICQANPVELPCYMLAVDADWCKSLPEDLKYLMADLALYYMQHPAKLAAESTYAVSSESVDGHSISYNTSVKNELSTLESVLDNHQRTIKAYCGPYSPYNVKMRVL